MLRLKHALPLALLFSVPVFSMDKQLVAASEAAPAAPSVLLSTLTLADQHTAGVTTLADLKNKRTELATAEEAKAAEIKDLVVKLTAKLAEKRTAITGSVTTIQSHQATLAKIKEDAAKKEAELKAEVAKQEADLQGKIAKEEEVKKALEAEAAKLDEQINPKPVEGPAEAPKTETPAPTKAWWRLGW